MATTYQYIDNTEYGLPRMIQALLEKALLQGCVKPNKPVVIDDYDVKRVYLTIDEIEYTLRIWNEHETEKMVIIEWTLYSHNKAHGLASGNNRFRKADYPNENEPTKETKLMPYQVYLLNQDSVRKHPEGKKGLYRQNDVDSIDERQYSKVYEGCIEVPGNYSHEQTLDEIFKLLNTNHPEDYRNRSLSVGDVVILRGDAYYCDSNGWEWHLWHAIDDDMQVMEKHLREWMKKEKPELLTIDLSNAAVENADGSFTFRRDGNGGRNEYRVKDYDDVVATMLADIEKHGVSDIHYSFRGSGWLHSNRFSKPVKNLTVEFRADGWKRELMHFRSDEEEQKRIEQLKAKGIIK